MGKELPMDSHQKRASRRVSFKHPIRFKVMGDTTRPPDRTATDGEILDVSDTGMKIKEEGRSLRDGLVLVIRVPIAETQTTIPTMAQVQWVKPAERGFYEAGLMFMV
jgi:c-di-GMP-binding flagellar brake protein YcgR